MKRGFAVRWEPEEGGGYGENENEREKERAENSGDFGEYITPTSMKD